MVTNAEPVSIFFHKLNFIQTRELARVCVLLSSLDAWQVILKPGLASEVPKYIAYFGN